MAKRNNKREALGKGIRALLQDIDKDTKNAPAFPDVDNEINSNASNNNESENDSISTGSIARIPLEKIEVNPFQPRADFDEDALKELAESIEVHGVIQPITVRRLQSGAYQLIAGERRTRASRLAGLDDIPAYIREANDQEMLEIALIENIQREDLNPLEVALNYQRLLDECKLTQEKLANRLGKSRSAITNFLRLLKLAPGVQHALKKGGISMGHGRALLGLETFEQQEEYCLMIMEKGLSVRDTELLIKQAKSPNKVTKEKSEISAEWVEYRNIISHRTGSAANIRSKGNGRGEIVISFKSEQELTSIIERLDN